MINFETGVADRVRVVSNILMLILLIGNIFFSIQYIENIKQEAVQDVQEEAKSTERLQTARFMKFFIDTVLNTGTSIAYDDRVRLENDIRQLHDKNLTDQWDRFVNSKDSKTAQESVVKLMSMLSIKML